MRNRPIRILCLRTASDNCYSLNCPVFSLKELLRLFDVAPDYAAAPAADGMVQRPSGKLVTGSGYRAVSRLERFYHFGHAAVRAAGNKLIGIFTVHIIHIRTGCSSRILFTTHF